MTTPRHNRSTWSLSAAAVLALALGMAGCGTGADDETATPSQVVAEYFAAIAEGDAERALSYLKDAPPESSFLTDDVLASSAQIAPIEGVEVDEVADTSGNASVPVSFTVGDRQVRADIRLLETNGEPWRIADGLLTVNLGDSAPGISMAINGQDVPEGREISLFPGSYELSSTNASFQFGDGSFEFVVESGLDLFHPTNLDLKLSDSGSDALAQAVSLALEDCLAETTLDAGCGLSVPDGVPLREQAAEGDITRSLTEMAQQELTELAQWPLESGESLVRVSQLDGQPTMLEVTLYGGVRLEGSDPQQSDLAMIAPAIVDMTADPVVTWGADVD